MNKERGRVKIKSKNKRTQSRLPVFVNLHWELAPLSELGVWLKLLLEFDVNHLVRKRNTRDKASSVMGKRKVIFEV